MSGLREVVEAVGAELEQQPWVESDGARPDWLMGYVRGHGHEARLLESGELELSSVEWAVDGAMVLVPARVEASWGAVRRWLGY